VTSLGEKILGVHRSLEAAAIPHAFGGALALAWCTRQPRGTSDIDVNVFAPKTEVGRVLRAMPAEVVATDADVRQLTADGQARLHWEATPVDVFLNTTPFHSAAASRARLEPFSGEMVPFLSCFDLAVFKAFFDRRRDWADLEDMVVAATIDVDEVAAALADHLATHDARIGRLRAL
jgi:hypothetical protein